MEVSNFLIIRLDDRKVGKDKSDMKNGKAELSTEEVIFHSGQSIEYIDRENHGWEEWVDLS